MSLKSYIQARRKRCGMAAVAAPKICRERERKKKKKRREKRNRKEKEKREERKEVKGEESKRERCTCIRPMGVNHPLRSVKRL